MYDVDSSSVSRSVLGSNSLPPGDRAATTIPAVANSAASTATATTIPTAARRARVCVRACRGPPTISLQTVGGARVAILPHMNADVSPPGLTRRRALALGAGALAASLPATRALAADPTRPADPNLPVTGPALEPEIISVTDTALAAWWRTDTPMDSLVLVEALDGPDKGRTRTVKLAEAQTVHAVRVDDLRPGTRYRYEMR